MKPTVETNRETGTMKIDNIEFNVEQTKAISHLLEAFEKKVTEDVCNKIISHERSQGDTTYLTFDSHRLDTYDYENVCVFHDKNLFSYFKFF